MHPIPTTDMGYDGVERERAVAAEHLDDDAEEQRINQPQENVIRSIDEHWHISDKMAWRSGEITVIFLVPYDDSRYAVS